MTDFQYTNRIADLSGKAIWQPGDPWDLHYGDVGMEDRDQQLEDYLNSNGLGLKSFATIAARDASTPTPGRLAYVAATDRIYVYASGAWVYWTNTKNTARPGVFLAQTGQAVANNTVVNIVWQVEASDVDGWITAPGSTLTVPTGWDGRYLIMCTVRWSTASLGAAGGTEILLNGAGWFGASGGGAFGLHTPMGAYDLGAGSTLGLQVFQNSGVGVTCDTYMTVTWLHR